MDNKTIAKRIAETTAPPSVIEAVTALIAENERLRATIDRNINNALELRNFVSDGIDYADAKHIKKMVENIANDLKDRQ